MEKSLYTDKNTEEDIEKLSETDSDSVIYNLYEDILILKEQLAALNKEYLILYQLTGEVWPSTNRPLAIVVSELSE